MALSRFLAAVAACFVLTGASVSASEIQDINQQYRNRDLNGALDTANRYLAKNPKDAQARFLKGLILADQGKVNDAIGVFTALTEEYPELPEPYNNLAVLYASQSKYDAAKDALEMAIRAHPDYATAHENLGDIYARMAGLAYGKAITLDSRSATARAKFAAMEGVVGAQSGKSPGAKPVPVKASASGTTGGTAPSAQTEVEAVIAQWAQAWSARNVDAYFAAYARDYAPSGTSRAEWEAQRRARIAAAQSIDVKISDLKIALQGDTALAKFHQAYRSDRLSSNVTKTLKLARQGNGWRIVSETSP